MRRLEGIVRRGVLINYEGSFIRVRVESPTTLLLIAKAYLLWCLSSRIVESRARTLKRSSCPPVSAVGGGLGSLIGVVFGRWGVVYIGTTHVLRVGRGWGCEQGQGVFRG